MKKKGKLQSARLKRVASSDAQGWEEKGKTQPKTPTETTTSIHPLNQPFITSRLPHMQR